MASADLVQVWGGASWLIFYYDSGLGYWRRHTDVPASSSRNSTVIPAGRPIMIKRSNAGAIPAESLLAFPLPYGI